MKIAVYSIAKNEEMFVERWCETTRFADVRLVLDTGSTDNTIEILKRNGVIVHQERFSPWRFDLARNTSLNLLPNDVNVCISLDMDEILCENWRIFLEGAWTKETTMLRYPFFCKPRSAYGFKVHSRHDYFWKYAIHEVLVPKTKHVEAWTDKFTITHLPKDSSSSYLKELEYWHSQEPEEIRYIFYLAREYFDKQEYGTSLKYLNMFLDSRSLKDTNEECFVHRMISWCLKYTKANYNDVVRHLFLAVGVSPNCPEAWGHLAEEMFSIGDYPNAFSASLNAMKIKDRSNSYSIEEGWNNKISQILQVSSFALGISANKVNAIIGGKISQ